MDHIEKLREAVSIVKRFTQPVEPPTKARPRPRLVFSRDRDVTAEKEKEAS